MSEQAKHTKLPWSASRLFAYGVGSGHCEVIAKIDGISREVVVADTLNCDSVFMEEEQVANADFIVLACNSHADLLAACEECLSVIDECYAATGHFRVANTSEQRMKIERAISKARGVNP